jgi:hypothetical protein
MDDTEPLPAPPQPEPEADGAVGDAPAGGGGGAETAGPAEGGSSSSSSSGVASAADAAAPSSDTTPVPAAPDTADRSSAGAGESPPPTAAATATPDSATPRTLSDLPDPYEGRAVGASAHSLHDAAATGDARKVQAVLEAMDSSTLATSLSTTNAEGWMPAHYAAINPDPESLR